MSRIQGKIKTGKDCWLQAGLKNGVFEGFLFTYEIETKKAYHDLAKQGKMINVKTLGKLIKHKIYE